MSDTIKLGIIGLGEVAQTVHLPALAAMKDKYELTAICDVSPRLVDTIGDEYRIAKRYLTAMELLHDPDLDAVYILNSDEYHAECMIAAAERGLHAFVEKPMCLTIEDAERVIAAKNDAGTIMMVGYMRRYAPAFKQALREVKDLAQVNYARFVDIIGPNSFFIGQTNHVHRFQDVSADVAADKNARGQAMVKAALGDLANKYYGTYRQMGGLCSHDLSAMRDMFGMPKRVKSAGRWRGDQHFIHAIFDYGDFAVSYETGVDQQGRFDASIEVGSDVKSVRVNYDTAYIRHLPTTLTISETEGDSFNETVTRPTYTDPYTIEAEHFYDAIKHGAAVDTPPEDAVQDLLLFRMMIEAMEDVE